MINVWGADHGGYVKRMQAAVRAVSGGEAALDVKLCQLVNLLDGGEPVKMSKRAGTFITLREVVDRVGAGVFRFIMLTRKNDASLDFDFQKVMDQSKDNPVFYVQYAHARCSSVLRHAAEMLGDAAVGERQLAAASLAPLTDPAELGADQGHGRLAAGDRGRGPRPRAASRRLLSAGPGGDVSPAVEQGQGGHGVALPEPGGPAGDDGPAGSGPRHPGRSGVRTDGHRRGTVTGVTVMAMAAMQESGGAPRIDIPDDGRPGVSPQGAQRSRQPLVLAVGALIVALIAVGSFLALSSGTHTRVGVNTEDLPVIRADARPFKVSPQEPGGMDVPNRDKLVYSRLKGVAGAPEVERLLPPAETPLPLPAPPAAATALATPPLATPSPVAEPHDAPGQTAALPSPAVPAEAVSPAAPAAATATAAAPAPRPTPRPAATAGAAPRIETKPEVVAAAPTRSEAVTPAAVTTKAPSGKPAFLVQLGAMSSADAARAQWQKLMSGNRDLLGGLQPSIAEANLADRRLYRLRAGPMDAPETAQALCKALSGRSVGCVVVSTGG